MNHYPGQVLRRCGRWELIRELGPCGQTRSFKAWDPLQEHFVTIVVLAGIDALELVRGTAELEASLERWTEGHFPASSVILDFDPGGVGEDAFIVLERPPDVAPMVDDVPAADPNPSVEAAAFSDASDEAPVHPEARAEDISADDGEPTEEDEPAPPPPAFSYATDDATVEYADPESLAASPDDAEVPATPPTFSYATDDGPEPTRARGDAALPEDHELATDSEPSTDTLDFSPEPDNTLRFSDQSGDAGEPDDPDTAAGAEVLDDASSTEPSTPITTTERPRASTTPLTLGRAGPKPTTLIVVIAGAVTTAVLLGIALRTMLRPDEPETAPPRPRAAATREVVPPASEPTLAAATSVPEQKFAPATDAAIAVAKADLTIAIKPTTAPSPAQPTAAVPTPTSQEGEGPAAVDRMASVGVESAPQANRPPKISLHSAPAAGASVEALDEQEIHALVEAWLKDREASDRRRPGTRGVRYALKGVQISPRSAGSANVTVTYEIENPSDADGFSEEKTVKFYATGPRGFGKLNPFLVD